jgi:hypothetical protein
MSEENEGVENTPAIGVSFSATTDGDLASEVFDSGVDRSMTTGEILVLACYLRAVSDPDWGMSMVEWFEGTYADMLTPDTTEEVVQGVAV